MKCKSHFCGETTVEIYSFYKWISNLYLIRKSFWGYHCDYFFNSSYRLISLPDYSINSKSFPSLTKFCPALYLGQSLPRLDSLISWIHPLSYTRRSRSSSSWFTWRYSSWRYTWSCRTISGPSSTLTIYS